jgi:hypothetical protein
MRGQRFQIVGLVRDARYRYLRQPILAVAYTPFHRIDEAGTMLGGTIVVRTSGSNPLALASLLRKEVSRARPEFRVSNILTERSLSRRKPSANGDARAVLRGARAWERLWALRSVWQRRDISKPCSTE